MVAREFLRQIDDFRGFVGSTNFDVSNGKIGVIFYYQILSIKIVFISIRPLADLGVPPISTAPMARNKEIQGLLRIAAGARSIKFDDFRGFAGFH